MPTTTRPARSKKPRRVRAGAASTAMARTGRSLALVMTVIAALNIGLMALAGVLLGAFSRGGSPALIFGLFAVGPLWTAALWFFFGRYLKEMGAVTASLDRMAADMVSAQRGRPRLRRPYRTDKLVAAGSILRTLILSSLALVALVCVAIAFLTGFDPVRTAILAISVAVNALLPWLYASYALHSSRALADVSNRMLQVLTRLERDAPDDSRWKR